MQTRPTKKIKCWRRPINWIYITIILFSVISTTASAYSVSFVEVDRFLCKNQSFNFDYDNLIDVHPLNENTTKLFNIEMKEELEKDGYSFHSSFDVNTSKNYMLTKNETRYELHTDGTWFYISKTIDTNLSFDMLKLQYDIFRYEVRYSFKNALNDGINRAMRLNCIAGDYNEMLMGIINIYDYPPTSLNCSYKTGSIYIDCSNDRNVTKLLTNIWSNLVYHDRRSYLWGYNLVFVDLDDLRFNQENRFDSADNPIIVLSDSEFASSLTSGQSIFVKNVKYLRDLEKLPIEVNRLDKDVNEISNFTSLIYSKLDKIKEKSKKGNDVETKQYIADSLFDSNKIDFYLSKLQHYQELYYQSLVLLNENPRYYYEDEYFTVAKRYLADFNSKLVIYQNKLDILRELHDTYNTFTNNIVSDINTKESTNSNILIAVYSILITIILFLVEQIRNRYDIKIALGYFVLIMFLYTLLHYILGFIIITTIWIIVIIGIIIWLPLPKLLLIGYHGIHYFQTKEDKTKDKSNGLNIFSEWWIKFRLKWLFYFYMVFSDNELDYKEQVKFIIFNEIKILIKIGNNHICQIKKRKKDISLHNYNEFDITKDKARLFQSHLEIIRSNNKIVKADEVEFNKYSKQLDEITGTLLTSLDKKVTIDIKPYRANKKKDVGKNDEHSKK